MINNIIFDWSGVVKDCVLDYLVIINKIFTQFGAQEISLEELKEEYMQPYMLFYKKYIPDITDEQQSVIYKKAILESPKAKEYSGMSDLIKKCKTEKKRLFVVSSDHPETLLPEIQSFGLDGVFSEVIFGVYDKEEGVLKIIQDNNLKKDETVFIGDSNHEIEVGQKVGIKTIAVTWGFSSEIKLQSKNPDYLVHSVEELEKIIL